MPILGIPFLQNIFDLIYGQQQQQSKEMKPWMDVRVLEQCMIITTTQTWPLITR